jgi:hypothetical protein
VSGEEERAAQDVAEADDADERGRGEGDAEERGAAREKRDRERLGRG